MTEWRAVAEFPGYEASDDGRVRSLPRSLPLRTRWGGVTVRRYPGRELAPYEVNGGHLGVDLVRDGIRARLGLHSVVLRAFVGPPPPGHEGLHRDGDPANNVPSNLRWGTSSENNLDAVRHGTHVQARKTRCPWEHLLAEPNLTACDRARGRRKCLACDRARSCGRRRGWNAERVRADADRRYVEIMRGAPC